MGLLKPWNSFEIGDRCNLLFELVCVGDGMGPHFCNAVGYSKPFHLVGVQIQDGHFFTVVDARVCEVGDCVTIGIDEGTLIWPHTVASQQQVFSCIELCSGAGFTLEGIKASGFHPLASVESNDKFRELHSAIHDSPFICCDIGSIGALKTVFELHAEGSSVMAGINCQPYSVAGDKRKELDQRASSLPKALSFAWLIGAQVVVLECTPLAMSDEFVQHSIRDFAYQANMTIQQQVLRLGSCWASRRDRWWCVMAKRYFSFPPIPELPVMHQFQKVSQIMPYVKHWPDDEVAQLVLSLYEHGKFIDYGGGLEPHFLDMNSQMATALHAWGNQIYPCKCGCRVGFSEERLRSKGLHGQLIPGGDLIERMGTMIPCCRHLHPKEVMLLCCSNPLRDVSGDMRLALAAAGQMASPLHAVWVFGHIRRQLQISFASSPVVDPMALLCDWQSSVLQARDLVWPTVPMAKMVPTRTLSLPKLPVMQVSVACDSAQGFIDVHMPPGTSVREVIEAELKLTGDQELYASLMDDNGRFQPCSFDHVLENGDFARVSVVVLKEVNTNQCDQVFPSLSELDEHMYEEDEPMVPEALDLPMDFRHADEGAVPGLPVEESHPTVEKAEFDFTMWQDPLSKLSRSSLLQVLCPQVLTIGAFEGLRKQQISGALRKLVLKNQDGSMGDDEMLWQLHRVAHASVGHQVVVWDPLVMTALAKLRQGRVVFQWASSLPLNCLVITAVVVAAHWIPVVWKKEANVINGFSCFVPSNHRDIIQDLHAYVCRMCGSSVTSVAFADQLPTKQFCGTAAIRYVAYLVLGENLDCSESALQHLYLQTANAFRDQCLHQVPRPWIWGLGSEGGHSLDALLRQHGVEEVNIEARCEKVMVALGREHVSKALKSQNPWKNLKWLANQKVPPYQLIQPAELQNAIAARSKSGVPLGNRAMKAKGKGKGKQSEQVNPDLLRLEPGVFVGNEKPLPQLQVAQIGPVAAGVVLATLEQALPYLTSGKQVSMGSLGIVVLHSAATHPPLPLIGEKVKFPVFCVTNAEPLIVEGDLYQLGNIPVLKNAAQPLVHLKTVETCVVKAVVFRDGIEHWSQVASHPIQYILSKVACLNKCQEEVTCDCQKWHAPSEGVADPLMELWNRQWLSLSFSQVKPQDSDMFSVTIRAPKALEIKLMSVSGGDSIVFEPRSLDGRKPSEEYVVIWLQKATAAQALLKKQTNVHAIGLARLGTKWGLRCRADDASKLHSILKPDTEFLPAGQRLLYLIGPLPFGTVRQSLVEAFRSMNWSARPLHAVPAVRNVAGVMWKVQSTTCPPQAIVSLPEGEAVITRYDQAMENEQPLRPVIGSNATVNICKQKTVIDKSGVDPFQVCDPWAKYQPSDSSAPVGVSDVVTSMEQRVLDAVIAQIPKQVPSNPEPEGVAARVEALEKQVFQIHHQQQSLHQSFQDQSVAHQAQLNDLQVQFQMQHGQLEAAVAEQGQHLSGLTANFQTQLEKQQSQLDRMFSQQMTRIEDLLGANKKARMD